MEQTINRINALIKKSRNKMEKDLLETKLWALQSGLIKE